VRNKLSVDCGIFVLIAEGSPIYDVKICDSPKF